MCPVRCVTYVSGRSSRIWEWFFDFGVLTRYAEPFFKSGGQGRIGRAIREVNPEKPSAVIDRVSKILASKPVPNHFWDGKVQ
jgi:hypothetical protein